MLILFFGNLIDMYVLMSHPKTKWLMKLSNKNGLNSGQTKDKNLEFWHDNAFLVFCHYFFCIKILIKCMLTLESQRISTLLGGVLILRTKPNRLRINKELQSISISK